VSGENIAEQQIRTSAVDHYREDGGNSAYANVAMRLSGMERIAQKTTFLSRLVVSVSTSELAAAIVVLTHPGAKTPPSHRKQSNQ
jgi:hypothetical protein